MFEQIFIQQTPVAAQIYTQNYFEGPKTANLQADRRTPVLQSTSLTTLKAPVAERKVIGTATLADISDRRHSRSPMSQPIESADADSIIDKTVADRVTLLARKYVGQIDSEASARLMILTERLNRLAPPIELSTIDRVEEVVAVARRSSARVSALREKYASR